MMTVFYHLESEILKRQMTGVLGQIHDSLKAINPVGRLSSPTTALPIKWHALYQYTGAHA